MTIITQRHNLFLSPLWGGKTVIGEHTCHWLILHSVPPEALWRALCLLWRCVQEAGALDRSVCNLWALKNQHWHHSGFAMCWHSLWVKYMDLHGLTGKFQCAAWVVSSPLPLGLTWPQTWGPPVTGRSERMVLGVEWDWETIRHWFGFCCPSSAAQPSVIPDIIFHFEDRPSETLQAEMSLSSQPLLCLCVGL